MTRTRLLAGTGSARGLVEEKRSGYTTICFFSTPLFFFLFFSPELRAENLFANLSLGQHVPKKDGRKGWQTNPKTTRNENIKKFEIERCVLGSFIIHND